MSHRKSIRWLGSSFRDLGRLPIQAKRKIGVQLDFLQDGLQPLDWKPMKSIGVGVREIRVRTKNEAFRVVYLAKFSDLVYVLHVFQKKSRQTSRSDIEIARRRFKTIAGWQRTVEHR